MSKRKPKPFVEDILEAIGKICKYTSGKSFEDFYNDPILADAVVRNLGIIGEAANRLPHALHKQYGNIPWEDIIGLRNRIIHDYFDIDYEVVWNIVNVDLIVLKGQIERILTTLEE